MAIDVNIPSQVKNYANLAAFPATGSLKTIFIAEDTNKTYRWTGSAYVEISASQATAWGTITGTLSAQTDLNTALSGKVPTSRTLTINGTTQDLSADRTFTISTGITIGTTAITSGTVGRVLFEGTGNVVSESANLFWDNTNGRLGIGTSSPDRDFTVTKASATNGIVGLGVKNTTTSGNTYSAVFNDLNEYGNLEINGSTWPNAVNLRKVLLTSSALNGLAITIFNNSASANFSINTTVSQTERFRIVGSTGNVLINTTTDAGFKLDVNGTARFGVSGATTVFGDYNGGGQSSVAYKIDFAGGWGWGISNMAKTQWYFEIRSSGQAIFGSGNTNYLSLSASAKVQIDSTTQGFLPPRMTTTQKNAIATPAEGLQVWDTTLKLMSVYNGTAWITL